MEDLTTKLQNFAISCQGRADRLRAEAAEVRRQNPAVGWAGYDQMMENRAKALEASAAIEDARGAKAREGFLLIDPADMHFQMDQQEFVSECQAAHRAVYVSPQDAPEGLPAEMAGRPR